MNFCLTCAAAKLIGMSAQTVLAAPVAIDVTANSTAAHTFNSTEVVDNNTTNKTLGENGQNHTNTTTNTNTTMSDPINVDTLIRYFEELYPNASSATYIPTNIADNATESETNTSSANATDVICVHLISVFFFFIRKDRRNMTLC